jgi:multisubunit Na+/H+ antiporter MnhB subunit
MATSGQLGTVGLVVTILLWAAFSSLTDTRNKAILSAYPYPLTLTACQFAMSTICGRVFLLLAGAAPGPAKLG